MLLERSDKPIDNNWLTELKFDGIRLILSKNNGITRLYTRHNTEVTNRFPELTVNDLNDGTILDGELVVLNDDGKPDLELMMSRFKSFKHRDNLPIEFVVFDIIKNDGQRITHYPLIKRKEILANALKAHPNMTALQWIEGHANAYFELVKDQSLEGIVMKNPTSPYKVGVRSNNWLKVINYQFTDGLITGYRRGQFGLLLEGFNGERWGVMEHMSIKARRQFYEIARGQDVTEEKKFIHLKDPLPCKIRYRHKTKNGFLHIPTFVDWLV